MRAASFDYVRPLGLPEALSLIDDPGAVAIAGGQSLIPLLNERSLHPRLVVDIGRIAALREIVAEADGLRIGGGATLTAILAHPVVRRLPFLEEVLLSVATPAVRNRATLAGNLVRANPASELPVAMVALDAVLHLRSRSGERRVAAADFFLGPHRTALEAGEIVTAIAVPAPHPGRHGAFEEIAPRAGAPPLACLAVMLDLGAAGEATSVRVVAGGVTGVPAACPAAEAALVGWRPGGPIPWPGESLVPHPDLAEAAYALVVLPALLERAATRIAARSPGGPA